MEEFTSTATEDIWANLVSDALAEVFMRLPLEERLSTVPLVCKNWKTVSYDAACWTNVDVGDWFQSKLQEDSWWDLDSEPWVEIVVKLVVDRSAGQLRELKAMHCSDATVDYIAERCPLLTVLSIPNSPYVMDKSATKLAANCPRLQELDVSDCYNISNAALECIGRNCPSLVWLRRNMMTLQGQRENNEYLHETGRDSVMKIHIPEGDAEAMVMSKHMAKLKHLEMKRTSLSDLGLEYLARGCGMLESLNVACCVELSPRALAEVSKRCTNMKEFVKPITPLMHANLQLANVVDF